MFLAGAGCASDTVPSRIPSEQDYDVSGSKCFPSYIGSPDGSDDGAELQVLCHIAGMVNLTGIGCGKTYLVAI